MYPAKFSFNPHATPSCANDFVVFPVNAVGSATLCSPYVAYGDDLACLGNDIGVLYRIKNVLCTTTACPTDPVGSEYAPGVMVIDNSSASAQASSIYFNALNEDAACSSPQTGANTGGCAVKLTQAGLR